VSAKPRIEVVFRRGAPVMAFVHFDPERNGRTNRQIGISPPLVGHYDDSGRPSGLEIPLPLNVSLQRINEALAELGRPPLTDLEIAPLRSG
jgi:hypothetical protein